MQTRLSMLVAAAGIKGSAHALRHSFATDLLARIGDPRLVQRAMGYA